MIDVAYFKILKKFKISISKDDFLEILIKISVKKHLEKFSVDASL